MGPKELELALLYAAGVSFQPMSRETFEEKVGSMGDMVIEEAAEGLTIAYYVGVPHPNMIGLDLWAYDNRLGVLYEPQAVSLTPELARKLSAALLDASDEADPPKSL